MYSNAALAGHFLISTLFGLYIAVVLLRVLLQKMRADYYNPLSQIVMRLTQPLVKPLRRIVPGWRGWDLATLLLALLLALLNVVLMWLLFAPEALNAALVLLYGFLRLIHVALNLLTFTILAQALMSWFSPGYNPMMQSLAQINEPLLGPVRRLIPSIGGLDLSPLFVLIGLQVLNILLPLPSLFR